MKNNIFKSATLSPMFVSAGDSTEFVIKLKVGPGYTAGDSRIVFDFSCTLGTSCPTRMINEASGYVEAYISNPAVKYNLRCWDLDYKHFVDRDHPASREAMRLAVLDLAGGLRAGDTIELHWGETTGGFGPGAKVSSVVPRPGYKARIDVRYFDSQEKGLPDHGRDYEGYTRPVPDGVRRLQYAIMPRAPHRLRLIRQTNRAILIPYDVFWNVAEVDAVKDVAKTSAQSKRNAQGAFVFKDKNARVHSQSLPFTETPAMDNAFDGMHIYWGDIHTHSAYSVDCAQRSGMDMTPGDLMKFARDRAGLDFFAVTDHHIPWRDPMLHLGRANWDSTLCEIQKHNQNGKFAVFAGFEFTDDYGDICIIFKNPPAYDSINIPAWRETADIVAGMPGHDLMVIPHFHSPGKRPEGQWRRGIEDACPVMEIFSDHGSYECEDAQESGRAAGKQFRRDRCGRYFLRQGHKYGFVASSDDHKGHVGVNGLTAVFARELTRDAIFNAYKQRQVYGTTNARIRLVFTANDKLMGAILPDCKEKRFAISVAGENQLKKVELFRNGELFESFKPRGKKFVRELVVHDTGPDNWYVRVTQIDNHVAWSSPIWFER